MGLDCRILRGESIFWKHLEATKTKIKYRDLEIEYNGNPDEEMRKLFAQLAASVVADAKAARTKARLAPITLKNE